MGFQNVSDLSKILFLFSLPTAPFALQSDPRGRLKPQPISLPTSFPFHHLHSHLCSSAAPGAHCCWRSFLLTNGPCWTGTGSGRNLLCISFSWFDLQEGCYFLKDESVYWLGIVLVHLFFCCEFGLEASPCS